MPTDEHKLQQFVDQLEDLLHDFRSNKIIDENSKKHQRQLEKLLDQTSKILNKNASKQELKQFDELVKYTQQSFKELKRNNKNNEDFQKEFHKTFGNDIGAGSVNARLMKSMASSVSDMVQSVNALTGKLRKDATNTSLNYLTGPFGKMFEESVDVSKAKNILFGNKPRGQFDAGVSRVPQRGTYTLDQNERVLSPDTNSDLTKFLDRAMSYKADEKERDRAISIYNQPRPTSDFNAREMRQEDLHNDLISVLKTNHVETIKNLRMVRRAIFLTGRAGQKNFLDALTVSFDRFMRHPMWNSLLAAMTPLTLMGKGLRRLLFGKKKSDTDRIVESNEDILEFLRKGHIENKAPALGQFLNPLRYMAQRYENRAAQGQAPTWLQGMILGSQKNQITRHGYMSSPLQSRLLSGDRRRDRENSQEDMEDIVGNVDIIANVMEWFKSRYDDMEEPTQGKSHPMMRLIKRFGLLGLAGLTVAGGLLKGLVMRVVPALGGVISGALEGGALAGSLGPVLLTLGLATVIGGGLYYLISHWVRNELENPDSAIGRGLRATTDLLASGTKTAHKGLKSTVGRLWSWELDQLGRGWNAVTGADNTSTAKTNIGGVPHHVAPPASVTASNGVTRPNPKKDSTPDKLDDTNGLLKKLGDTLKDLKDYAFNWMNTDKRQSIGPNTDVRPLPTDPYTGNLSRGL